MIMRARKSTIMDQQGRIFVNADLRKAMGLLRGGPVEFYVNDQGQVAFRAAH